MSIMAPRLVERLSLGVTVVLLCLFGWLAPKGIAASLVIVFVLFFYAHEFGTRWLPHRHPLLASFAGLLALLAGQSLAQTVAYYAGFSLDHTSDLLSLATTLTTFGVLNEIFRGGYPAIEENGSTAPRASDRLVVALLGASIVLCVAFVLRHAQTHGALQAIRTPWALLPAGTLAAVGIASVSGLLIAWRTKSPLLAALSSALVIASVTFIAPLIYKLGFGFDGFLHKASEQILATTGTLVPKPPYYIGQYVFTTWLSRLFQLPLDAVDTYLVPTLAAFLPFGFLFAFSKRQQAAWAVAGLAALLPLASFVVTTPQSFAYLLGIFGLCLAIGRRTDGRSIIPSLALVAWSCATHPIAGLPFLGTLLLVLRIQHLEQREQRPLRSPIVWLLILLTAFSVPFAFYLNSLRSSAHVAWDLSPLTRVQPYVDALVSAFTPPRLHTALWPDWTSYVLFLLPIVLVLLTVYAIRHDEEERPIWIALLFAALGTALAGFLLNVAGDFTFLIEYERSNYADRLFVIAHLLLLPPALSGFGSVMKRIKNAPLAGASAFALLFIAWQGAQAYAALPRYDAADASHGWSVGSADIEAVRFIDHDAGKRPYTVLANQSVSAAAVQALGFKRYAGDVFFYPIPTGGPLYERYLQAVGDQPSLDIIKDAAKLGQTDLVYVVLNDYWWNADQVAEELGTIADSSYLIQNGKARVYRFDFSKDKNR